MMKFKIHESPKPTTVGLKLIERNGRIELWGYGDTMNNAQAERLLMIFDAGVFARVFYNEGKQLLGVQYDERGGIKEHDTSAKNRDNGQ